MAFTGFFAGLKRFVRKVTEGGKLRPPHDPRAGIAGERKRIIERAAILRETADRKREQDAADQRRQKEDDRRRDDPVYRFVNLGEQASGFGSSNVGSAWYEIDNNRLFIRYLDGSTYQYESVSPREAESFITSSSKGKWIWDNLRIRGTKLGARKEYAMVFGPSSKPRAWDQSAETARAHSEEVARQSGAPDAYAKLGKFARKTPLSNTGRRP